MLTINQTLIKAFELGNLKLAKLLLEHGADVRALRNNNNGAL